MDTAPVNQIYTNQEMIMNNGKTQYRAAAWLYSNVCSVSAATLREWVARGWVRSLKLGPSQQSARLYNVGDVKDVLDRMSTGRQPHSKRRRAAQANGEGA